MHAVLSHSMAALLFIHALLGCCWHHAHRSAPSESTPAQTSKPVACCHHQDEGESEQQPQAPCDGRLECQGICTYLPPQKTQIDFAQVLLPFDHVAVLPAAGSDCLAPTASWEFNCGPLDLKPPLRLHLLHQILLI